MTSFYLQKVLYCYLLKISSIFCLFRNPRCRFSLSVLYYIFSIPSSAPSTDYSFFYTIFKSLLKIFIHLSTVLIFSLGSYYFSSSRFDFSCGSVCIRRYFFSTSISLFQHGSKLVHVQNNLRARY